MVLGKMYAPREDVYMVSHVVQSEFMESGVT